MGLAWLCHINTEFTLVTGTRQKRLLLSPHPITQINVQVFGL